MKRFLIPMVGMLAALPNTQLSRRLLREGRLEPDRDMKFSDDAVGDQCTGGLNFETARPRRDILNDYKAVLERIYTPDRYFARGRAAGRLLDQSTHRFGTSLRGVARDVAAVARLLWWVSIRQPEVRRHFARAVLDCTLHNHSALRAVVVLTVNYLHVGPFSRRVVAHLEREIARIDSGDLDSRRSVSMGGGHAAVAAP